MRAPAALWIMLSRTAGPAHPLQNAASMLEGMLSDLRRCVEIESPSHDKTRCDAFASFFADLARDYGARVERLANRAGGDHLVLRWGEGDAPVLFLGHYDTVWPAGTLERKPFSVEGNVARGPGIFDMKAGLVQALWAARRIEPVVFIVNSDEEIGSPASRALIEEHARKSRAVFVFEPSHRGALKTARKGVGIYTLEIEGRAVHAGVEPEKGVNAIDELARATLALHALTDYEKGTTVNVDVVQGGTVRNTIAAHARAEIDVRVKTAAEAERVRTAFHALRPHHPDAKLRVTGDLNRPPMERGAKNVALYERARDMAKRLGFALDEVEVGGGSDGNFAAAVGATVLDGLGAVGDGAHAEHEHILVDALVPRTEMVVELALDLIRV
jgi:glutamate carboxypeptidase